MKEIFDDKSNEKSLTPVLTPGIIEYEPPQK